MPVRKQLRWEKWDYSQTGLYFITICTYNRQYLFGDIVDGKMMMNDAGRMIVDWLKKTEERFPDCRLTEHYVVMPDHIHFIIEKQSDTDVSQMMQWFKKMTTNAFIHGVREHGWQRFNEKLWQRSFYDEIIRNSDMMQEVTNYIYQNPSRWNVRKLSK